MQEILVLIWNESDCYAYPKKTHVVMHIRNSYEAVRSTSEEMYIYPRNSRKRRIIFSSISSLAILNAFCVRRILILEKIALAVSTNEINFTFQIKNFTEFCLILESGHASSWTDEPSP